MTTPEKQPPATQSKSRHRPGVELVAPVVKRFRQLTKKHGHQQAAILYTGFAAATRVARLSPKERAARGIVLPAPIERAPRGQGQPKLMLMWTQNAEEFHLWVDYLEAAGTNLPAVMTEFVQSYNEVRGDLTRMAWPWRTAELAVAV